MAITRLNDNSITSITALPSGCTSASGLSLGKVLQVVTLEKAPAEQASSSSSFVTPSGYGITITPSATSSKILVQIMGGGTANPSSGQATNYSIFRGTTNLGNASYGFMRTYGDDRIDTSLAMQVLDTPNTTSATTYNLYYRSYAGGTVYLQQTVSGVITFTAMEIAG